MFYLTLDHSSSNNVDFCTLSVAKKKASNIPPHIMQAILTRTPLDQPTGLSPTIKLTEENRLLLQVLNVLQKQYTESEPSQISSTARKLVQHPPCYVCKITESVQKRYRLAQHVADSLQINREPVLCNACGVCWLTWQDKTGLKSFIQTTSSLLELQARLDVIWRHWVIHRCGYLGVQLPIEIIV
jgi:hypothetical protein